MGRGEEESHLHSDGAGVGWRGGGRGTLGGRVLTPLTPCLECLLGVSGLAWHPPHVPSRHLPAHPPHLSAIFLPPPCTLPPFPLPPPPHGTLLYFMASLPVSFSPRLPPWHSSLFLPLLLARFFYHVFFFFPPRVYSLNFFFASCFLFYFHCHLA